MKDSAAVQSTTKFISQATQMLGPLLALVVVIVLFAILDQQYGGGQFATWRNARTVTIQNCTIAMAALGMTLIIISGGIDLSCGTAITLAATVLAWGLREDVGCLVSRGDNYASAARQLEETSRSWQRASDDNARQRWQTQFAAHRSRLTLILQDKLQAMSATDSQRSRVEEQLQQLEQWTEPAATTSFRSLDGVPNAASTVWLAVMMGVGTGVMCGLMNGALVSYLRVVPFIVTLGTMTIYLGIGNWLGNNIPIRPSPKFQIPSWLQGVLSNLNDDLWFGFPLGVWITLAAALVVAAVLRYSVFGRYVFALGSNEQTARLCGINVPWNKVAVYTCGGLLLGLAGILQFSRLSSGNPMSGQGMELQIIAAVVIGGGSLNGGKGSVLGTLAGVGIMAVIISGGTQLGMSKAMQDIILGVVIIGAVTIDQVRQRLSQ